MKILGTAFSFVLLMIIFASCKKNTTPKSVVDLNGVRLTDFKLLETEYVDIDIIHPQVNNGIELQRGKIDIVVPKANTGLNLTPKTSNFIRDSFDVSPKLGQKESFLNKVDTYTIYSKQDKNKAVHYDVRIAEEEPVVTVPKITGFKFEKAKNLGLQGDIEADKITDIEGSIGRIIVFVPLGTNFSELTPTINFQGQQLVYTQDVYSVPENSTTVYPNSGIKIDFAYPKVFFIVARAGSSSKTYEVIVDVRNPIKLEHSSVTTPDVVKGAIHTLQLTNFSNQGNHPIELSSIDHTDYSPVGTSAIRAFATIPSFGLLPGQTTAVIINVSAQSYPPGTYKARAVFKPKIFRQAAADDLLQTSSVLIQSTIID